MTRHDTNEASVVQNGLNTLADVAGASEGDAPLVGADGLVSFGAPNGGSQPASCFLEVYPLDLHGIGFSKPCKWNHLYDDPTSQNALVAIPAGLGLAFAFDGSSETITATETGVWAFTLGFAPPGDPTWVGSIQLDSAWYIGRELGVPANGNSGTPIESVSEVVKIPAGGSLSPQLTTRTDSTADPYNADVYLEIVRLA